MASETEYESYFVDTYEDDEKLRGDDLIKRTISPSTLKYLSLQAERNRGEISANNSDKFMPRAFSRTVDMSSHQDQIPSSRDLQPTAQALMDLLPVPFARSRLVEVRCELPNVDIFLHMISNCQFCRLLVL